MGLSQVGPAIMPDGSARQGRARAQSNGYDNARVLSKFPRSASVLRSYAQEPRPGEATAK
jgi:hypothetical protein